MVYRGETAEGSSGGAILKAVKGIGLKIVGLHRGGYADNWDRSGAKGYNYGSLFTEINKSLAENWNPLGKQLCMYMYKNVYLCGHIVMSYNRYLSMQVAMYMNFCDWAYKKGSSEHIK